MQHPAVHQASVIGVKDNKYGEEVAAFLHLQPNKPKPDLESLKSWVGQTLARHKRPRYVYWVGDENVGDTLPQTGSGKIKKNVLREIGDRLVASGAGQV
jgi:acyl-CoA synthetase (AMP-forming)/AMP-acid ligase II